VVGRPHPERSCLPAQPARVVVAGVATVLLLGGCATALKRETRCLVSLTPEIVQAREEIADLEASWHDSLGHRETAPAAAGRAYQQLLEAKARHRPLLGMYDQVYRRVRTRTEEEEILSQVRMVMLAGPPSLVFYPIIRWNVRSVLWDGADPDSDNDPVTRFCADRLTEENT
jgi:hypothetical protein